jgi:hypothetical protein
MQERAQFALLEDEDHLAPHAPVLKEARSVMRKAALMRLADDGADDAGDGIGIVMRLSQAENGLSLSTTSPLPDDEHGKWPDTPRPPPQMPVTREAQIDRYRTDLEDQMESAATDIQDGVAARIATDAVATTIQVGVADRLAAQGRLPQVPLEESDLSQRLEAMKYADEPPA